MTVAARTCGECGERHWNTGAHAERCRGPVVHAQRVVSELLGQRIVGLATSTEDDTIELELAHRGTDDGACTITVPLSAVRFADEETA